MKIYDKKGEQILVGFHVRNDGAFVYIVRADLLLAGSNLHYYALGVRKERKFGEPLVWRIDNA